VGADYYTFISQIEAGRGRIPPDRYTTWATALGIEPKIFVQTLMRYYDPVTYEIVFADWSDITIIFGASRFRFGGWRRVSEWAAGLFYRFCIGAPLLGCRPPEGIEQPLALWPICQLSADPGHTVIVHHFIEAEGRRLRLFTLMGHDLIGGGNLGV
jgi:hypothetical protein